MMHKITLKWKKLPYDPNISLFKLKGNNGAILYVYATENKNNWDFQVIFENKFRCKELVRHKLKKKEFPTREDCIPLIIEIMENCADDLYCKEMELIAARFEPMRKLIKCFKKGL